MLSGERKKFELRTARKPILVGGLSNTVLVYATPEPEWGYINFGAAFVDAVGAHLPRGVSDNDPAFVQVVFDQRRGKWVISARYVASQEQSVLWMSDAKPTWLKELKKVRNNNEQSNAHRSAHRAPGSYGTRASARIAA